MVIAGETAHGLEQQLIDAVVDCLAKGSAIETPPAIIGRQDAAVRFEALLQTEPERVFRTAEICQTLGIPVRTLHISCEEQLGMGPTEYIRRRRVQPADPA